MKLVPLVLLTSATFVGAEAAHAQESRDQAPPIPYEITPHVSVGSNSSTGVGASVRWPIASKLSIEVETAVRQAEVTGLSSSVSLLYDLPSIGRVTPYVAGGAGFQQDRTADEFRAASSCRRERHSPSMRAVASGSQ